MENIKEVVQAFQGSNEQMQSLLDVFPQIVWTALPDGEIDYINKFFYQYTGGRSASGSGRAWKNAVHPDDIGPGLEKWEKSHTNGSIYEAEQRVFRSADSSYVWHLVRATPIKDKSGKILKWLGIGVDIHARKRTEENLTNFVYIASHDLRSPVNNIKSIISLFNARPQEEWDKLLPFLTASAERLNETLEGISELIAVERLEEPPQYILFDEVLDHVIKNLGAGLKETECMVFSDFSASPGIKIPVSHLRTIFFNLLDNAVKYCSPERRNEVRITSSRKGDFYVLSFADKGSGMNFDQNREKLFRPFTRLTTAKEGRGLGLYLVKNIAEKNNGSIEVESEEGKGTTFRVFLKENQE